MKKNKPTAEGEFASQLLAELHGIKHAILTVASYLDDYIRLIKEQDRTHQDKEWNDNLGVEVQHENDI